MLPFLFSAIFDTINNIFFLCGYVSNPNSFPQPLTPDEELKFIQLFKNGSEDARNILIERNLRLVAHIVKKYNSFGSDSDDLISIGTIGLIKAISTYDYEKGTRLATYAARCIENAIPSLRKHSGTSIDTRCLTLFFLMDKEYTCWKSNGTPEMKRDAFTNFIGIELEFVV